MSSYWLDKRVLVTGAGGFIGSCVVRALMNASARVTASCTSFSRSSRLAGFASDVTIVEADLCEPAHAEKLCRGKDVIINLAHSDGSLAFKRSRPAFLFHRNMLITLNMLDAASQNGVGRFLLTSSTEVYPLDSPVPIRESHPFLGQTDRSADGYVWSKRMSELATTLFAHEYGISVLVARPSNIYGPGDDFDEGRGRVIPSFIRRALDHQPIVIWGNGEQVRSFLYVEDLVRGLLGFAEHGNNGDVVNFSGEDCSIRQLAQTIVRITDSRSEIRCEADKPSGPAMRVFDNSTASNIAGFLPLVPLEEGLRRTLHAHKDRLSGAAAG